MWKGFDYLEYASPLMYLTDSSKMLGNNKKWK